MEEQAWHQNLGISVESALAVQSFSPVLADVIKQLAENVAANKTSIDHIAKDTAARSNEGQPTINTDTYRNLAQEIIGLQSQLDSLEEKLHNHRKAQQSTRARFQEALSRGLAGWREARDFLRDSIGFVAEKFASWVENDHPVEEWRDLCRDYEARVEPAYAKAVQTLGLIQGFEAVGEVSAEFDTEKMQEMQALSAELQSLVQQSRVYGFQLLKSRPISLGNKNNAQIEERLIAVEATLSSYKEGRGEDGKTLQTLQENSAKHSSDIELLFGKVQSNSMGKLQKQMEETLEKQVEHRVQMLVTFKMEDFREDLKEKHSSLEDKITPLQDEVARLHSALRNLSKPIRTSPTSPQTENAHRQSLSELSEDLNQLFARVQWTEEQLKQGFPTHDTAEEVLDLRKDITSLGMRIADMLMNATGELKASIEEKAPMEFVENISKAIANKADNSIEEKVNSRVTQEELDSLLNHMMESIEKKVSDYSSSLKRDQDGALQSIQNQFRRQLREAITNALANMHHEKSRTRVGKLHVQRCLACDRPVDDVDETLKIQPNKFRNSFKVGDVSMRGGGFRLHAKSMRLPLRLGSDGDAIGSLASSRQTSARNLTARTAQSPTLKRPHTMVHLRRDTRLRSPGARAVEPEEITARIISGAEDEGLTGFQHHDLSEPQILSAPEL